MITSHSVCKMSGFWDFCTQIKGSYHLTIPMRTVYATTKCFFNANKKHLVIFARSLRFLFQDVRYGETVAGTNFLQIVIDRETGNTQQ